jgi:phosphatidylglycerol:prolipoprotein diacylglycerol transferase
MLPEITIFGHTIALYGLMILIGVIIGTIVAFSLARRMSIKNEDVIFAIIYGIIGFIVGGKLLYLIIELPLILQNIDRIIHDYQLLISLLSGGFVFYGGFIAGFLLMLFYCRRYQVPTSGMIATIIPIVPLVHAFGRIGCFFAGCCYGIPYEGWMHIVFHRSLVAPNEVSLFPVQLLESAVNFGIFLFLYYSARKAKSATAILTSYLILYSIMRFFMEYLRGDSARGFLLGLSVSQWISILLLIIAIFIKKRHSDSISDVVDKDFLDKR